MEALNAALPGALTRRAGAVAMSRLANDGAAFATGIVLAWVLSREANGVFQQGYLVARMAVLVGALGIPASLYYFLPRLTQAARAGLAMRSVSLLVASGGVFAALAGVLAPAIAAWMGDAHLAPVIRAGCAFVVVAVPALAADPLLVVGGRARLLAGAAWVAAGVQLALVVAVAAAGWDVKWVFWALSAGAAIRLAAGLWAMPGDGSGAEAGTHTCTPMSSQVAFCAPLALAGALDAVSAWLDRILVSLHYPSADYAVYAIGAIEVPFIGILTGAVMPVILPELSAMLKGGRREDALRLWHRAALKAAPILFGLFAVLVWIAPQFLAALYSGRYRDSAPYFRIYLALLPLRVAAYMPVLQALNRNRQVLIGAVGEIIVGLCLSLFFMIPCGLGMAGAAAGYVAATVMQIAYYLACIRGGFGVVWGQLLPWRRLAANLAIAVIWFLPVAALAWLARPADWVVLAAAAALFAAYAWIRVAPALRG